MLGRTTGAQLFGVEARLIDVEVDLAGGLPTIAAVGLPDSAVREGIDRIRSALKNAGFRLPPNRVVINLAPADVRKQGASLDLPIAVALLNADEQLPPVKGAVAMVGELALDGSVRAVRGVVSIALAAREAGRRLLLVPPANFEEASLVDGIEVAPVGTLADVAAFGAPGERPAPRRGTDLSRRLNEVAQGTHGPDLREVRGQPSARRALEIAAAGGHHLLLCGAPGSGKTMLARRMPGILPPMSVDESLDATRVWSAAGLSSGPVLARPFRAPHHGVSLAGMTGGGRQLRPGEVSLATHGVLYLDELIEFRRDVLEALRQPIEDGVILVSRVHGSAAFPARFTLVASMNPCPCGYYGTADARCACTPREVRRYRGKLSGPLLDRFDLTVQVRAVELSTLTASGREEPTAVVRVRVVAARGIQRRRFARGVVTCNARMGPTDLERFTRVGDDTRTMMLAAADRLRLSARGFDRVRRVARTIADLAGAETIASDHVAEALQYRQVDPVQL